MVFLNMTSQGNLIDGIVHTFYSSVTVSVSHTAVAPVQIEPTARCRIFLQILLADWYDELRLKSNYKSRNEFLKHGFDRTSDSTV